VIIATSDNTYIKKLIQADGLPVDFLKTVSSIYEPLARDLARRADFESTPLIVGISGAQGAGKSTLTRFLVEILGNDYRLKTAFFSLDDIYLTKQKRLGLATKVHHMFLTRGVPGTHDLVLGKNVINKLKQSEAEKITSIPVFDKAMDDRAPESKWKFFQGKPSVIIVEGWCIGAFPDDEKSLEKPINALERDEDPDGVWRHYVNRQLETSYQDFFSLLDVLIYIPVPRWELVYEWRLLQEQKLKKRCMEEGLDSSALMRPHEIVKFVQHYERITRHSMNEMPERADYVLTMGDDHKISGISGLSCHDC